MTEGQPDEDDFRFFGYALALYHDEKDDDADDLPENTDKLRWQYETLTSEQVRVVEQWLMLVRDQARITDWDRESIDRALHLIKHSFLDGYNTA